MIPLSLSGSGMNCIVHHLQRHIFSHPIQFECAISSAFCWEDLGGTHASLVCLQPPTPRHLFLYSWQPLTTTRHLLMVRYQKTLR